MSLVRIQQEEHKLAMYVFFLSFVILEGECVSRIVSLIKTKAQLTKHNPYKSAHNNGKRAFGIFIGVPFFFL
jgi:hypothetical protein